LLLQSQRTPYNEFMQRSTCKWRLDAGQIEVVDEAVAEILRQKTPAERIALASEMHRTARLLITARLQEQHPEWTDEAIAREVARRMTREVDPVTPART
jgi:hypothetical protein